MARFHYKKIKLLSKELSNIIAAGEVIERPASVIKELFENSIDAQANCVNIYLENSGKKRIQVSDNGLGIKKSDLPLTILPFATSKIYNFEDLKNIKSMGFRGEALSSISAIAKLKLISKTLHAQEAWSISNYKKVREVIPSPHPVGTTVEVSNIFFNMPARYKFLRADGIEYIHIDRLIKRLLLYHFDIELTLKNNNKDAVIFPRAQKTEAKIKRIARICGNSFSENCIFVNENNGFIKIYGWLGKPSMLDTCTNIQYIYINGRMVKNNLINNVIKRAYENVLYQHRKAAYILHININPSNLDVNVHPTKREVRIHNSKTVLDFIFKTICKKLSKSKIHSNLIVKNKRTYFGNIGKHNKTEHSKIQRNFNEITESITRTHKLGHAIGQLNKTYILSQVKHALVIIDIHAAHERILYENMKKNWSKNKYNTQILLLPLIFELSSNDVLILQECEETLEKIGLKITFLGETTIVVKELPTYLLNEDVPKLLEKIAESMKNSDTSCENKEILHKILSTISCNQACTAKNNLTMKDMNYLIRKMESTNFIDQCNHGRPTWVKISMKAINKFFLRN